MKTPVINLTSAANNRLSRKGCLPGVPLRIRISWNFSPHGTACRTHWKIIENIISLYLCSYHINYVHVVCNRIVQIICTIHAITIKNGRWPTLEKAAKMYWLLPWAVLLISKLSLMRRHRKKKSKDTGGMGCDSRSWKNFWKQEKSCWQRWLPVII